MIEQQHKSSVLSTRNKFFILLTSLFTVFFLWMCIAKVDITTQAVGVIVPEKNITQLGTMDWPFVLMFLIALLFINWTAAVIASVFMIIMMVLTAQRVNLNLQQDSTANLEIFLMGLMTIVILSVGAYKILECDCNLTIGMLIGSNILASRALQGANKYAKAKEAIARRDRATAEIINFIKQ